MKPIMKIRSPDAYRWFHAKDIDRSYSNKLGWDYSLCGLGWPEVYTVGFAGFEFCLNCERKARSGPTAAQLTEACYQLKSEVRARERDIEALEKVIAQLQP